MAQTFKPFWSPIAGANDREGGGQEALPIIFKLGLVTMNAFGANSHQPFVTTWDCEQSFGMRFRKPTSVAARAGSIA